MPRSLMAVMETLYCMNPAEVFQINLAKQFYVRNEKYVDRSQDHDVYIWFFFVFFFFQLDKVSCYYQFSVHASQGKRIRTCYDRKYSNIGVSTDRTRKTIKSYQNFLRSYFHQSAENYDVYQFANIQCISRERSPGHLLLHAFASSFALYSVILILRQVRLLVAL